MDQLTYFASLRQRYNLGNWPRRQFGTAGQWAHLNRAMEVIRLRRLYPMFSQWQLLQAVNTVVAGGTLSEKQLYTDAVYISRLADTFSDVERLPKPSAITTEQHTRLSGILSKRRAYLNKRK